MYSRCVLLVFLAAVLCLVTGTAGAKVVGYWPLNEGSGTTAADASGNNHNGTIQGNPTWIDGPPGYGKALSYNGQNPAAGWVNCGTWNPSAGTGQLTVAFWAKWNGPIGPDAWQGVVGKRDNWDSTGAGAGSMWEIEISATSNAISFFRGDSYPNCGGKILPIGEWTHVAAAFDGSTLVFYLDGAETGRGSFSFGPKVDATITIGCDDGGGWNSFNGSLDEVRLYDNSLSATEIKKLSAPFGASKPNPADGAVLAGNWVNASWQPGSTAVMHELYFGTNYDDVYNGTGDTFRGKQPTTFFLAGFPGMLYPQGLLLGQTYYWRVDEVEAGGTIHKGAVWSFLVPSKKAYKPSPVDGAKFVDPNADLTWSPGLNAIMRQVYFGQSFGDVNQATVGTPAVATSFEPGTLEFEKTYYWRVDEFDGKETYKGSVWSFTVTPPGLGHALLEIYENVQGGLAELKSNGNFPDNPTSRELVTTFEAGGYGDAKDNYGGRLQAWLHVPVAGEYTFWFASDDQGELWLSTDDDPSNARLIASVPGYTGAHEWEKYPSQASQPIMLEAGRYYIMGLWQDGISGDNGAAAWQGPGIPDRAVIAGMYLKPFEALSAFGARPYNGAVDVPQTQILSWKPGKKAAQHEVYFGEDEQAIADATPDSSGVYKGRQALDKTTFDPGTLEWNTTYFWRVDEVNDAVEGSPWKGNVWKFTAADFVVVDDFESYTDEEGNRIFDIWVDGWTNTNGSTVGHVQPPYAEQQIVHGGKQSMPLDYNNIDSPFYSEAETEWPTAQNWTVNGVKDLTLYFRGSPPAYLETADGITMSGSGHDIWDEADDFRFAWKRLSGNGSIIAKVESIGNTNTWAKGGVMIRESLDAGAKFAYMVATPGQGVSFGWRKFANDVCGSANQAGISTPQWVKLTRTGDAFTAQYSADGETWTDVKNADGTVTSTTLTMTGSIYIGLCVTSHDSALTTTAVFSGAATTGGVSGQWQVAAIGDDPQGGNSVQSLYVTLQDSAGKSFTVVNPDAEAVLKTDWTEWKIPLSEFTGVSATKIKKMYIGVGDKNNPVQDGRGLLYIDDIRVTKP